MIELLPWIFTTGWASGINPYLVVVALSLADRFGNVAAIPDALGRADVLVVSAILCLVDMVADKVPYIDSTWDAIHTVIRPAIGTGLALMVAGDAGTMEQAILAATGGITALISHLIKAGVRAGVNTSPEPVSNVAVSTAEDVAVAGVMTVLISEPYLAAAIAGLLLLISLALGTWIALRIRSWRARRRT